jgi:hypothetical protein
MGYGRRRLIRNLFGSAAVTAVVAGIGLGLPAINSDVPAVQPVSSAQAYPIGAGVTVVPPPDASLDATATRPGSQSGTALFVVGGVRYAVVVTPFTGSLDAAAARLRSKIMKTRGYQVTGPESPIVTRAGVNGRQGVYASPGRDGRYAVFLDHGVDVEITVAGNGVDLRPVLPDIEASVLSIAFEPS